MAKLIDVRPVLPSRREQQRIRVRGRRTWRLVVIVSGAVAAGAAAVLFAKLCDLAMAEHVRLSAPAPYLVPLLLPLSFALVAWLTRRLAPESAGSGIPQIIAAAEEPGGGGDKDRRVSFKTAVFKVVASAGLLVCGASIGREGPTVQVSAAVVHLATRRIRGRPSRRALLVAGGAAGVAGAFNTPIAGVVFGVEELARGFDRRTNTVVILTVVAAGAAAYALAGNYAYFGELRGSSALWSAWFTAPVVGLISGLAGGAFSRALAFLIGPGDNRFNRFRRRRPVVFAFICGLAAALAAYASGGLTYGTGYAEARSLLGGHPLKGLTLAVWKWVANLAAAGCGAPGGIFSPALATGAGIGAALAHVAPFASGRDTIVLGMAGYLAGVVQAPLTSAVILMEMTRDPGLVGPLMLSTLIARAASAWIMPEPIYHVLSHAWRAPKGSERGLDASAAPAHTPAP